MNFETEEEWGLPLGIGNSNSNHGDFRTDIMLMAILVKGLDIIDASGGYGNLKSVLEEQVSFLKNDLQKRLPQSTPKKPKSLSAEDKKFVAEELFNIIKGKDTFMGIIGDSFLKDYIVSTLMDDDREEDEDA